MSDDTVYNAYWNGEPAMARRVIVRVGKALQPTWWCADLEGTLRRAVEVTYEGQTFFLDDEDRKGWMKVTFGYGSPEVGHSSLPDTSEVVEAVSDAACEAEDALAYQYLEKKRVQMLIEAGREDLLRPGTFREFHNEMRKFRRREFYRPDIKGTYVREKRPGEIKGKKALKAAKRARVRAMKAEQAS